jgi:ADP-ribose pyrophosphatase YjhB (NUDIX family)
MNGMQANDKYMHTHRVAVNAYIYKANKFLLLKRASDPKIWGPPGGRLAIDEDPISGLHREVQEETNLEIEVLAPANTWFGIWKNKQYLLSIDYLVRVSGGSINLSSEHTDYAWVRIEEMQKGNIVQLNPEIGFKINDFQNARRLFKLIYNF